jgi:hypothetical protein
MLEAFADFAAFVCDDPENGRVSPVKGRPTGTGIPLAKKLVQAARKQKRPQGLETGRGRTRP